MAYSTETLVAMRLLGVKLARHQEADTIGDHLVSIKNAVNSIPAADLSPVLEAIQKLDAHLVSLLAAINDQQQKDSAKLDFVYTALKRLAGDPAQAA